MADAKPMQKWLDTAVERLENMRLNGVPKPDRIAHAFEFIKVAVSLKKTTPGVKTALVFYMTDYIMLLSDDPVTFSKHFEKERKASRNKGEESLWTKAIERMTEIYRDAICSSYHGKNLYPVAVTKVIGSMRGYRK